MTVARKQKPPFQVRLDDSLEFYLREKARQAQRPLTSEVRMRLERTRQQDLAPSMETSAQQPATVKETP